jgi:hypothetical protein
MLAWQTTRGIAMIRKFSVLLAAVAVLSGCASTGYGYRGGSGDYYYDTSASGYYSGYGYYDRYDRYGYGPYGYGGFGYPYSYYPGGYYSYYPVRPRPPVSGPGEPERVVRRPYNPIPGYEFPDDAVPFPNKPERVGGRVIPGPRSSGDNHSKVRQRLPDGRIPDRSERPLPGRAAMPVPRPAALPAPASRSKLAPAPRVSPAPASRRVPAARAAPALRAPVSRPAPASRPAPRGRMAAPRPALREK